MKKEERQRELLYELRKCMMKKFKCEPFKILPDEVIDRILAVQPKNQKVLSEIKGLPQEGFRVKMYGDAIVSIILNWAKICEIDVVGSNEKGYKVNVSLKRINAF